MTAPIPEDARTIAIVCPSWVGDTVMATPVLRAIRRHRPDAKVVAVTRPGLDVLLRGAEFVDDVIAAPFKGRGASLRTGRAIRRTGADALVLLPNSFRAGLIAKLSGAAVRIGYRRDRRGWLLSHAIDVEPAPTPTPAVDYYARLACVALGVDAIDLRLELGVTGEEDAAADTLLDGVGPFALINPGGNRNSKRWPAERFAAVADHLARSHGLRTVVTGAPSERNVLRQVVDACDPARRDDVVDLAARGVDLGSLKAVVRRCAIMVTNDTGPRHLAAAFARPTLCLFGPTDHRWTTLDCPTERIVVAEPFLPEALVADAHPKACVIDRIPVDDVVRICGDVLRLAEVPA